MRGGFLVIALIATSCGGGNSYDILHRSEFDSGTLSMSGTISLPASVPAGRLVVFAFRKTSPVSISEFNSNITRTGEGGELNFQVTNLSAGSFYVSLMVDSGGDELVGNGGDLVGYYGGTLENPVVTEGAATIIELTTSRSDINFGLGD